MTNKIEDLPTDILNVSTLPAKGHKTQLNADEAHCVAIASFAEIDSLDSLHALVEIKHWNRDGISVEGAFKAAFKQKCVISNEPIDQNLDHSFSVKLAPEGSRLFRNDQFADGELVVDFEAEDPPEPFSSNEIDLWANCA